MRYTMKELEQGFSGVKREGPQYRIYSNILDANKKLVGDEEVKYIYPKNMFMDGKNIEIYTFLENHIFITKNDKENILTSVLKIKDIEKFEKIEKVEGNEYDSVSLKIYFYNGEEFNFNSGLDTNQHHSRRLRETINGIINLLIKRV